MTYKIVTPIIVEEITDDYIDTIPTNIRKNLILIDNSQSGFGKKYQNVEYYTEGRNIGVSRAWNIGVKKILAEKIDYLIIHSASMRFEKGALKEYIDTLGNDEYGLFTQHGWHCIALSRLTFEKVGLFDENFFAYYEDSDFIRRMELLNIHCPVRDSGNRIKGFPIRAHCAIMAHAIKSGVVVNIGASRFYFIRKWGADPSYSSAQRDLLYKYPFNNSENKIDYCEKI